MTGIQAINENWQAINHLHGLGLISYHPIIYKMMYDRAQVLRRTGTHKYVKVLAEEFGYSKVWIMQVLKKLDEEV